MDELETLLQSLQALKPPGVTKTKIDLITKNCVDNVQSDSIIVQKIVQQFKNSPVTHKLGVLYVLDTVTRQWLEKAKQAGQAVSRNAAPGTFASGVQKVTDVLPTLMIDLTHVAPDNQKDKIIKLLDIWERSQTFPREMLIGFKQLLNSPQKNTYTPPGSPPKNTPNGKPFGQGIQANHQHVAPPAPAAAPQDTGSLLAALANLGQQAHQTNAISAPVPAPVLAPVPAPAPAPAPALSFPQGIVPPPPPGFIPPPPVAVHAQPVPPSLPAGGPDIMTHLLQAIASGAIPQEQAMQVLAVIAQSQQAGGAALISSLLQPAANAQPVMQDINHADRYEQNGSRYRDRSRSPDINRRRQSPSRRSPPNRRDSPTYGVYDPNAGAEGNNAHTNDRERGRTSGRAGGRNRNRNNEYRQRTPPAGRRQSSPSRNGQQKYLEWDNSLPRDNIRVLSRTLFVGGAGGTEGEIRNIFSRFGKVQTCIVNQERRHAFVKMVNRQDAVAAKAGMDNIQDTNALSKARQTRWGVGFGPRDCSDYETGISVIPISRLTDADRKWVSTAEFGGTGGRALEGGMVIEEPDIEIGAGVSSKAISRRVPPDAGRRGGHGHGGRGGHDNGQRHRNKQEKAHGHEPRHISPRPEPAIAVPPAVPGFGFSLPGF